MPDSLLKTSGPSGAVQHQGHHLLVYVLRSGTEQRQQLGAPVLIPEERPANHRAFHIVPTREHLTTHVVVTGPATQRAMNGKDYPMTASKWILYLNGIGVEEESSVLASSSMVYARDFRPWVQPTNQCPDGVSIAHFRLPSNILATLQEDFASMDVETRSQFELMTLRPEEMDNLYLVSHFARRTDANPAPKQQSTQILNSIRTCPGTEQYLVKAIQWNRYDVLIQVRPEIPAEKVAQDLRNWEAYTVRSMSNLTIIRPSTNRVTLNPPFVHVKFPPALSFPFIIEALQSHLDIISWQVGPQAGEATLELSSMEQAAIVYGCQIPCAEYGMTALTCGDAMKDQEWMHRAGLSLEDDLLARLASLKPPGSRRLTAGALLSQAN